MGISSQVKLKCPAASLRQLLINALTVHMGTGTSDRRMAELGACRRFLPDMFILKLSTSGLQFCCF